MVYTAAIWNVKPGREHEFLKLWQSLGERTLDSFPCASGTLLRNESSRTVSQLRAMGEH